MKFLYLLSVLSLVYSLPTLQRKYTHDSSFDFKHFLSFYQTKKTTENLHSFSKRQFDGSSSGLIFGLFGFGSVIFIIIAFLRGNAYDERQISTNALRNTHITTNPTRTVAPKKKKVIIREDLESYPIVTMKNFMDSINVKAPEKLECLICIEEFKDEDLVRVIPCYHPFHKECIDTWLLEQSGSCPECRLDLRLTPESEIENQNQDISATQQPNTNSTPNVANNQNINQNLQYYWYGDITPSRANHNSNTSRTNHNDNVNNTDNTPNLECTDYPKGEIIYDDQACRIYQVDGKAEKKTVYFDTSTFMFYILYAKSNIPDSEPTFVGYFSKEKFSVDGNNLACILTLPQFRGLHYGTLLVELSYEISKIKGQVGGPEKPLSTQGYHTYKSYWQSTILKYLYETFKQDNILLNNERLKENTLSNNDSSHSVIDPNLNHSSLESKINNSNFRIIDLSQISVETGISIPDILATLDDIGLLRFWKGKHVVFISLDLLARVIRSLRISFKKRLIESYLNQDCIY
ncbi:hypothetical protein BB559_000420 [Furculomyces boomerangus]|uniref:histone acetyltransferase n=1 Tax=Furculomyces boomerangus TaxID=61424 RepID=A0A2T9Z5B5_9FUNG|nr:hypothetical protein BB559_000420 [Furculomyces boomerangus]